MISKNLVPKSFDLWLSHTAYSNSLVVIYFGTKKKYNDSALSHHNLILGDDYRKLMREIFSKKVLPRDLGLYLHMPSKSDEGIAPPGCECFYVLSLVPNLGGKINWEEIKEEYTDRILSYLEKHHLPGLRENIVVKHSIDPLYFQNTLNSYKGAAFSFKPSALQSGYLRPQVQSNHFKNLYFVGAGVHPGAGVPAVLASGKIASTLINTP
jgi:phytoene desaturase